MSDDEEYETATEKNQREEEAQRRAQDRVDREWSLDQDRD